MKRGVAIEVYCAPFLNSKSLVYLARNKQTQIKSPVLVKNNVQYTVVKHVISMRNYGLTN